MLSLLVGIGTALTAATIGKIIAKEMTHGEVDIVPLINEVRGWRLDFERIVTIGYGENTGVRICL